MASRATLEQVAQAVGVASSTVSRVLRGEMGCAAPRTAQRIRRVAQELQYQPHFAARALASGQSRVVGVVIGRRECGVFAQQLDAISQELAKRGYQAAPFEAEGPRPGSPSFGSVIANGMLEGLVVCTESVGVHDEIEQLVSRGVPVVCLGETPVADVPRVLVDERAGTYMATRYLICLGHSRIAAMNASPSRSDPKDTGYRQALEEEGLTPVWMPYGAPYARPAFKVGYDLTQRLLPMQERPTAAVCSNDEVAVGVIRAMRDHGLRVPQDLALIGFDDLELARYCVPALTTVRQPVETWAAHAVERLFTMLAGRSPEPRLEVLAPELLIRESCSQLPA